MRLPQNDFGSWLAEQSSALKSTTPSEIWLTRKAWFELWALRPPMPAVSEAVAEAQRLVDTVLASPTISDLLATFPGDVAPLALTAEICLRPSPRLICFAYERSSQQIAISVDEGYARFVYMLLSVEFYDRAAGPSPDASRAADDCLRGVPVVDRVLGAVCGTIRATGGYYIPLVVRHSDASQALALWSTIGYVAFVAFHEIAHHVVAHAVANQKDDIAESALHHPHNLEMLCDSMAAEMLVAALRQDGRLTEGRWTVPLRGGLMVSTISRLVTSMAFLVSPASHPDAQLREAMVQKTMDYYSTGLATRILESPDGPNSKSRVREFVAKMSSGAESPGAGRALMGCIDASASLQLMVQTPDGSAAPAHNSEDGFGAAFTIEVALERGERYFARRGVDVKVALLEIGELLCGEDLSAVVPAHMLWAIQQKTRELLLTAVDIPDIPFDVHVRALVHGMVGQAFLTEIFMKRGVRRVLENVGDPANYGVTYDDLLRVLNGTDERILIRCADWLALRAGGVNHPNLLPEKLASELLMAVLLARSAEGGVTPLDDQGQPIIIPPEVLAAHALRMDADARSERLAELGFRLSDGTSSERAEQPAMEGRP